MSARPAFGLNRFDYSSPYAFAADVQRAEALGWDYAFIPSSPLRRQDPYVYLAFAAAATASHRPRPLDRNASDAPSLRHGLFHCHG
jgi:alkanesulfonate monooxygenase SsuD/methylene tetrahydromethanopterin reductase-like flavin-dependent oxidoreductase (luciferase family)